MVQCNFMIALPKGAPLVHHPTEGIHPAHHRMASTPLVRHSMKAIHLAHHRMASTPLVLHSMEAIHPAHHCMTSTPLVLHPAEAMQLACLMRATSLNNRQKMHGHHVMDARGRSKESYTKREGSMKSSRE